MTPLFSHYAQKIQAFIDDPTQKELELKRLLQAIATTSALTLGEKIACLKSTRAPYNNLGHALLLARKANEAQLTIYLFFLKSLITDTESAYHVFDFILQKLGNHGTFASFLATLQPSSSLSHYYQLIACLLSHDLPAIAILTLIQFPTDEGLTLGHCIARYQNEKALAQYHTLLLQLIDKGLPASIIFNLVNQKTIAGLSKASTICRYQNAAGLTQFWSWLVRSLHYDLPITTLTYALQQNLTDGMSMSQQIIRYQDSHGMESYLNFIETLLKCAVPIDALATLLAQTDKGISLGRRLAKEGHTALGIQHQALLQQLQTAGASKNFIHCIENLATNKANFKDLKKKTLPEQAIIYQQMLELLAQDYLPEPVFNEIVHYKSELCQFLCALAPTAPTRLLLERCFRADNLLNRLFYTKRGLLPPLPHRGCLKSLQLFQQSFVNQPIAPAHSGASVACQSTVLSATTPQTALKQLREQNSKLIQFKKRLQDSIPLT